jgi:hypothetical protein
LLVISIFYFHRNRTNDVQQCSTPKSFVDLTSISKKDEQEQEQEQEQEEDDDELISISSNDVTLPDDYDDMYEPSPFPCGDPFSPYDLEC